MSKNYRQYGVALDKRCSSEFLEISKLMNLSCLQFKEIKYFDKKYMRLEVRIDRFSQESFPLIVQVDDGEVSDVVSSKKIAKEINCGQDSSVEYLKTIDFMSAEDVRDYLQKCMQDPRVMAACTIAVEELFNCDEAYNALRKIRNKNAEMTSELVRNAILEYDEQLEDFITGFQRDYKKKNTPKDNK